MNSFTVQPSSLKGTLSIPSSKSHSQRALLFAMLARGKSRIYNLLDSTDTKAMIEAISLFGAKAINAPTHVEVQGHFAPPSDVIDAENSGQILRFLGAIAALLPSYTTITGDKSIRMNRPVKPLLSGLRQLGALAESARGDGQAPILVKGPIHPGVCRIDGFDSQPVSALLMATSFLKGPTEIFVDNPGELPWIDLTLDWLRKLGANISHHAYCHYHVEGKLAYPGFDYTVPGDFSTAAFPIAAALITESPLRLKNLNPDDIQGDRHLISILQSMGASIRWENRDLLVEPSSLSGREIDCNACIDALPILAVIGCFANGTTTLFNAAIARKKESNRIDAIARELKKMGAIIETKEDGLLIHSSPLSGAEVFSHHDHRIALALAVAAMAAIGKTQIKEASCIQKTYPTFIEDFQAIGARIELDLMRV